MEKVEPNYEPLTKTEKPLGPLITLLEFTYKTKFSESSLTRKLESHPSVACTYIPKKRMNDTAKKLKPNNKETTRLSQKGQCKVSSR